MNNTKVIFEYDETLNTWSVFVDGVKDNIEAIEAFNVLLIITRTTIPSFGYAVSKQQNGTHKILVNL